jgi:hypothetical protein
VVAELHPGIRIRSERGYALLAVVVLIAVLAVLASAITVNLGAVGDAQRVTGARDHLYRIETEVNGAAPSFFGHVGRNPSRLTQLIEPISTLQQNSCGLNFVTEEVDLWEGPYHLVPHDAGNFFFAPGFVAQSLMERVPTGTSNPGTLFIVIANVAAADAEALDVRVDGALGGTAGKVRYTEPLGTAPVTVRYGFTISGC